MSSNRRPRVWWVLFLVLLSPGTVAAQESPAPTGEDETVISVTEVERLRAYAHEVKNARDALEARVSTLQGLLDKCRGRLRQPTRYLGSPPASPGGTP